MAARQTLRHRRALWLLVSALLAAAALAWLLPPASVLRQRAGAVPPSIWAAVLLGLALSYGLRAARLCDEWSRRVAVRWRDALHVTLMHSAAVNLLPMRSGELSYPWLLYRRWGVALGDSAASLFWLRVQDALVLAAWAAVLFGPGSREPGPAMACRAVLSLAAILVLARWGAPLAARALRRLGPAGARRSRQMLHRLLAAAQGSRPRGWLWAIANWSVKLAALALLMHNLGDLAPLAAGAGALAGEVAAALPLQAPAGFGTYEAGVWLGVKAAQASSADAQAVFGAAFIAHLTVIAGSVLGAALSQCMQITLWPLQERL